MLDHFTDAVHEIAPFIAVAIALVIVTLVCGTVV